MTELIATCWTSAGAVRPGITAATSPLPISERVLAVAAAGFSGIGFELADLDVARASMGLAGLRRAIQDASLAHIEVEYLNDWWLDGPRREASDRSRAALLAAASELGAHHIKVGTGSPGDPRDAARLVDEFGLLSDQAASAGTRIALEPGAGSALDLVEDAIPLVVAASHPAGGLLLDPWHLYRSGIPYESVVPLVPAPLLVHVELSDAPAVAVGSLFDDTFDNRLMPGLGAFDVPRFVRAMRDIGYAGPWGVEVMSTRTRSQPVGEVLAEAAAAARAVLAG
jgi:sugar phosphate isomerase/epimerase